MGGGTITSLLSLLLTPDSMFYEVALFLLTVSRKKVAGEAEPRTLTPPSLLVPLGGVPRPKPTPTPLLSPETRPRANSLRPPLPRPLSAAGETQRRA